MKILFIDDDDTIQEYVRELLESSGFEYDSAFTSEEGRKKFNTNDYDLLLVDINLGEGHDNDGIELCRYFKSIKNNIPIIIVSARDFKEFKVEAFSCGADDYIVKPFSPDEFLSRIKQVLSRYGKRSSQKYSKKKILIVEDEETMQNVLAGWLKKSNYDCFVAGTTQDAWKIMENNIPDLIVLDMLLAFEKEYASLEFLSQVRKKYKDLPVVILTAMYTEPLDKDMAMRLGATDYLLKPIEFEEFISRINSILIEAKDNKLKKGE